MMGRRMIGGLGKCGLRGVYRVRGGVGNGGEYGWLVLGVGGMMRNGRWG